MPKPSVLDRTSTLRTFGVVFILLSLLIVWLTYAVFTKKFADEIVVSVESSRVGLQLSRNADVKVRGVIVGRVSDIRSHDGQAVIQLGISRDVASSIPSDVEALFIPKTLFGEKFVDLRPTSASVGRPLAEGDVITQAELPVEVEKLLNNAYHLLEALEPAQLSTALTALSTALEGQGDAIGHSLEVFSGYLEKIAPLTPRMVEDIDKFGQVAGQYADVMPEVGQILRNAVATGNTVVAKRARMQALFTSVASFSATTEEFLDAHGSQMITLSKESVPTLELLAEYAPTITCVFASLDELVPRIDEVFRDQRAHVTVEFAPRSPAPYTQKDAPRRLSGKKNRLTRPSCRTLPKPPYDAQQLAPGAPRELLRLFGLPLDDAKRATPVSSRSSESAEFSTDPAGSAVERDQIKALLAGILGAAAEDIPDVASMLAEPALRGTEVTIR